MRKLLACCLMVSAIPAFAAKKSVSFQEFKSAANQAAQVFGDDDSACGMTIEENGSDLKITVRDDKGKSLEVTVSSREKISVTESQKTGSVYKLSGNDRLTILFADDAFNEVTLSTSQGTVDCEQDL